MTHLKIAFIDHHLNNFHANTFVKILGDKSMVPIDVEIAAWELQPSGEDWCMKYGVKRLDSLEAAVHWADSVIVLAPDNLDSHFSLAARVLPAGKPTAFDKMLAPFDDDAEQIIRLGERYGAPLFSASALSFATELDAIAELGRDAIVHDVFVGGMGTWRGYGIHALSLALAVMGTKVQRVIDTGTEGARTVTLDYGDGRRAVVDVRTCPNEYEIAPWRYLARAEGRVAARQISDFNAFYVRLVQQIVSFFVGENAPVSVADALMAVRIINAADRSLAVAAEWQSLGA